MNQFGNYDAVENILADMRHHVSSLNEKLTSAGTAVNKSQIINEKILSMKEYQDKVNTMNSCWKSKNRNELVADLQRENRQMLALEEENRQLRFALKEMEDGMHLIMADYRRVFTGLNRNELLIELAKKTVNHKNANGCVEFENFIELARIAESCVSAAEAKIIESEKTIAQLRYENNTFRELLFPKPQPPIQANNIPCETSNDSKKLCDADRSDGETSQDSNVEFDAEASVTIENGVKDDADSSQHSNSIDESTKKFIKAKRIEEGSKTEVGQ